MPDYMERLVACGMNLADAYEVCDDYIYDSDYQGLSDYVRTCVPWKKNTRSAGRQADVASI